MTDATFTDALAILTDAELDGMIRRAWYAAARSNEEWLRNSNKRLADILANSANSDLAYWQSLTGERDRRNAA